MEMKRFKLNIQFSARVQAQAQVQVPEQKEAELKQAV